MSGGRKRRVKRIRLSLTPKQALVAWMQEVHHLDSFDEWGASIRGCSDEEHPLGVLLRAEHDSVQEDTKGLSWRQSEKIVGQATQELKFFYDLHLEVNTRVLDALHLHEEFARSLLVELGQLRRQQALDRSALRQWRYVSETTPYPAGPEMSAVFEAAQHHYVESWELLEDGDVLGSWVRDQYLAEGKAALSPGAYVLRHGEADVPGFSRPSEEELRAVLGDETSYDRFMAGEDFSHGVAGVPDDVFEKRRAKVERQLRRLVSQEVVRAGSSAWLETVPIESLREAPLVDGEWLDRRVVVLAEAGAALRQAGAEFRVADDNHPLAWERLVSPDGDDLPDAEVQAAAEAAEKRVVRFRGRLREIEGRTFLHFDDYRKWRGRKLRGKLPVTDGIEAASWNHWVDRHGGEGRATLAGVRVRTFQSWVADFAVWACTDEREAETLASLRREALGEIRRWTLTDLDRGLWSRPQPLGDESFAEAIDSWRARLEAAIGGLSCLRHAVHLVEERHFNGQTVLFPEAHESLEEAIAELEQLADFYNRAFAAERERSEQLITAVANDSPQDHRIDVDALARSASDGARALVGRFVAMSRATTLHESGETEQARAVLEPHAWPDEPRG